MLDNSIEELKQQWQRQQIDLGVLRHRLGHWRLKTYLMMAVDIVAALLALTAGVGFMIVAVRNHDFFYGVSGITLLAVCPVAAVGLLRARQQGLSWIDRTPEGTLRYALTRARTTERVLRIQFWNCVALLCFVGLIWLCVLAGWIPERSSILVMSAIWITWATGLLLWTQWRRARNLREQTHCARLVAKFEDAKRRDHP
jgi:hypothetical protein